MSVRVDERGRIVVPKHLRERFALEPGQRLRLEATREGILLRPEEDRKEVLKHLRGAIHQKNRDPKAEPLDPMDVKQIWDQGS